MLATMHSLPRGLVNRAYCLPQTALQTLLTRTLTSNKTLTESEKWKESEARRLNPGAKREKEEEYNRFKRETTRFELARKLKDEELAVHKEIHRVLKAQMSVALHDTLEEIERRKKALPPRVRENVERKAKERLEKSKKREGAAKERELKEGGKGEKKAEILASPLRSVVESELHAQEKVKRKRREEEEYKETVDEARLATGKPVPPLPAKVKKIVKPMTRKMNQRIARHEILISKFHKNTSIEEVKAFLEQIGLHASKVEKEQKPVGQWYNVYATIPSNEEMVKALKMVRVFFKHERRTLHVLPSRRPAEKKAGEKEEKEEKEEKKVEVKGGKGEKKVEAKEGKGEKKANGAEKKQEKGEKKANGAEKKQEKGEKKADAPEKKQEKGNKSPAEEIGEAV